MYIESKFDSYRYGCALLSPEEKKERIETWKIMKEAEVRSDMMKELQRQRRQAREAELKIIRRKQDMERRKALREIAAEKVRKTQEKITRKKLGIKSWMRCKSTQIDKKLIQTVSEVEVEVEDIPAVIPDSNKKKTNFLENERGERQKLLALIKQLKEKQNI